MPPSRGKVTVNFDFSHHKDGEKIGVWLRDIVRDGTIDVYITALWETGNATGYYSGKRERATTAANRKLYDERIATANEHGTQLAPRQRGRG